MIKAIDHIHLITPDLGGTIKFYTEVLGFTLHRWVKRGEHDEGVVYLRLGEMLVELNHRTGADSAGAGNKPFGLLVDDMEKTVSGLKAKGVEFVFEPRVANTFGGLLASIRDPNGVEIELKEYRGDSQLNPDWQPTRPGVVRTA